LNYDFAKDNRCFGTLQEANGKKELPTDGAEVHDWMA
jgi:hypothetical protein